jgi:hypothetical protein
LAFILTLLKWLDEDTPESGMAIGDKIRHLVLNPFRPFLQAHSRKQLLRGYIFWVFCGAYGAWVHFIYFRSLLTHTIYIHESARDHKVYMTASSIILSFLYVILRLRKLRLGIFLAICTLLSTHDFPVSSVYCKCDHRFNQAFGLPADLVKDVLVMYYLLFLAIMPLLPRADRGSGARFRSYLTTGT